VIHNVADSVEVRIMDLRSSYEELKAEMEATSIGELRAMPSWKKMQKVDELTTACRDAIRERLKERYPSANEQEIRQRFGVVWLGAELAEKAFGWRVDGDDTDLVVR
jgi:hypothetical protein